MILNEYTNENMIQNKEMIQEQYFFKRNKYLDKIEDCFEKAISIVTDNSISLTNIFKELKPIERELSSLVKDMFNFSSSIVRFVEIGSINAYTYDIPAISFTNIFKSADYNKIKTSDGVRYKKAVKPFDCTIGIKLLQVEGMTPRIATSVLLHEIGHNFFVEESFNYVFNKISIWFTMLPMTIMHKYSVKQELKNDDSISKMISARLTVFANNLTMISTIFSLFLSSPVFISMGLFNGLINKLLIPFLKNTDDSDYNTSYRNEQFADNFATSYGYGKEVIQTQEIFANGKTGIAIYDMAMQNKISGSLLAFILNVDKIISGGISADPHPNEVARMMDQIKYLKDQVKNVKDPKEKKILLNNIKECEKLMDEVKDVINNKGYSKNSIINKLMRNNLNAKGGHQYNIYTKGDQYKNGNYDSMGK